MNGSSMFLRHALSGSELARSLRSGLGVVLLFVVALVLVREYAAPIRALLQSNQPFGVVVFFVTSITAVLMPVATNLPLVPLAVLAFGPWPTAALLLAGWVAGSALSFLLARRARRLILRRFASVQRHADIDRLIDPRHRLVSLVLLRMTFPVDVLSYALGLFSRGTTLAETTLATALGAAPFALLFAFVPVLLATAQALVFAASVAAFGAYAWWVLKRTPVTPS